MHSNKIIFTGRRPTNEDRAVSKTIDTAGGQVHLAAVMDGHGGEVSHTVKLSHCQAVILSVSKTIDTAAGQVHLAAVMDGHGVL